MGEVYLAMDSELAFAIEALSGSAGMSGATTSILSALPSSRRKRRELLAWGLAGVLLLASIALAALYFRRTTADERPMRFVIAMPEKGFLERQSLQSPVTLA